MNEDRYVILNGKGESCWGVQDADDAQRSIATLSGPNGGPHKGPYTAHKIDPEPTVFESRAEKLERLVDEVVNYERCTPLSASKLTDLARELKESR